jgi:hypothetical protein
MELARKDIWGFCSVLNPPVKWSVLIRWCCDLQ